MIEIDAVECAYLEAEQYLLICCSHLCVFFVLVNPGINQYQTEKTKAREGIE